MRMILIILQKRKICLGQMNHFWPKNGALSYKWAILCSKMAHPHNSGLALRIFVKFSRMKGANRYRKILLILFQDQKTFGAI